MEGVERGIGTGRKAGRGALEGDRDGRVMAGGDRTARETTEAMQEREEALWEARGRME